MSQIKRTLWLLLTHSWISLTAVVLIFSVLTFVQVVAFISGDVQPNMTKVSVMLNIALAIFGGVYFGGGLLSLKQFYLWKINARFRVTLMGAYLVLVVCFSSLQALIMGLNINGKPLYFFIPFCVMIFTAQLLLETTVVRRYLIPFLPILIAQSIWFDVSENILIAGLVVATFILIYRMYQPHFSRQLNIHEIAMISTSHQSNNKPLVMMKFNFLIGRLASKLIRKNKATLDWILHLPHSRLAIFSLAWLAIVIFTSLVIGDGDKKIFEIFIFMFVASASLSIVIESRQLFSQLKPIAHLYSQNNHQTLKKKILVTVDKTYLLNTSILIVVGWIIGMTLSIPFEQLNYIVISVMLVLVSMVFHPLLLSVSWLKISFIQVAILSSYMFLLFLLSRQLVGVIENQRLMFWFPTLLVAILVSRLVTRFLFLRRPLETLLICK